MKKMNSGYYLSEGFCFEVVENVTILLRRTDEKKTKSYMDWSDD